MKKKFTDFISEATSQTGEGFEYIHYSNTPNLNLLTGVSYGRGIKGAEAERVSSSDDFRLKNRVYFYPKPANGLPRPEKGLGSHVYSAKLTNMYDPIESPSPEVDRLTQHYIQQGHSKGNAFEKAVLDSGYHGYHGTNMSVVLNKDVHVNYLGVANKEHFVDLQHRERKNFFTPNTNHEGYHESNMLSPRQMAAAFAHRDTLEAAAPSMKIMYGRINVKPEHLDNINDKLSELGFHNS